jgi:3-oxoadipate enol-lactonase
MRFRLKSGLSVGYSARGTGQPIALLHPIGLCGDFWQPVVERLARDYRLLSIDARGHGDSDVAAGPYSLDGIADDCLELLRTLTGPCVVVGCSMGSAVAQSMVVKDSDMVKAAVFANGSGPRTGGRTDVLEQRAARAERGMPGVLDDTLQRWFSKSFAATHPEVVARVADWLLAADPTVHAWAWRALAGRTDAYDKIGVPVLTIAGSEDASASPASVKALADALPNAQYVELAGAAHMAPLEQPDAFAHAVRQFLKAQGL